MQSHEMLPLDFEEDSAANYQHQPILQDFSYYSNVPPKHIIEGQKAVRRRLRNKGSKDSAANSLGMSNLRYRQLQEQSKKTKETIKNDRESDIMHMLRILRGPDMDKDSNNFQTNPQHDETPPPSTRSDTSSSALTYLTKSNSPVVVNNREMQEVKLAKLTPKEELLPPKQKLMIIENRIARLKDLQLHQAVIDLRTLAIALTRLVYGSQTVRLAEHYMDIGDTYTKMKAFEQASSYLRKGLMFLTKIVTNIHHHQQTTTRLINEDAMEPLNFEQEYSDARRLLPHVLLALGKCYVEQNCMKEAHGCLKEAKRQNDILKDEERDPMITFDISLQLSYLYTRMGRFDVSLTHLINAWETKLQMVGTQQHPDIAKVFREMASVHLKNGTINEAIENFEKAKKVYEEMGTPVGLYNAAVIAYTIGNLFDEMNNFEKASLYYEGATGGVESFYGPYDMKTIKVYERFARAVLEQAQSQNDDRTLYDKATSLYKELLKRKSLLYGNDSPEAGITLEILGDIQFTLEDFANALLYYDKAWLIADEVYGPQDETISLQEKRNTTKERAKQKEEEDLMS
ncbi:hypothetical protein C9374_006935 [Naegleria lovaniensis]|uniref:TPR-like protein n=1 Tax=Naegleria lovaniensis TaxID=51637 RepID=A0AA88GZE5_NAELO|nr:uncharacterized protein C9374_006935 [Naegleria lovaniensis]KAG2393404.1 hypothetical protein C9374_006935 [Naegleria lovaniensis]